MAQPESLTSFSPLATSELLSELAPRVRATVRAILGSAHPDVDDAVQQALIALIQALPAYRGECELAGYARVIATRVAISVGKRERVRRARRDDDAEPDTLAELRPSPAETLGARERKALMRDLLAEMPEVQAETLALRVVFGLTLDEIARTTGVPANTVRSRVRLAKDRLKSRIEADPALMEALRLS